MGGFEENFTGVITVEDDPEFANAIGCMVSYFYKVGYNASEYDTNEYLLHAQVATIADKYDCTSLHELAATSFANTLNVVGSDDWVAIAGLIYDHTTTELPAHVELRDLVVAAVAGRRTVLKSVLQNQSVVEFLRSNADLSTDLLLSTHMHGGRDGPLAEDPSDIFVCENCQYAHAGSRNCSNVASDNGFDMERVCPHCKRGPTLTKRYTRRANLSKAFSCPSCDGIHTKEPSTLDG
ncbi:hypothetical protein K458DRAFT_412044 [Lentithecium fluviatile CBS 122367]|uniref:BTB domain-containing protein n=1 Tax=Lentithecium fluviatile CBS 122367 TaxID=1168545 RepID=A0A6G1JJV0_9PLEO|nr:hypothetical protein K458DRAFT_412044 [Lentithecium fluviatile CBS 122367]